MEYYSLTTKFKICDSCGKMLKRIGVDFFHTGRKHTYDGFKAHNSKMTTFWVCNRKCLDKLGDLELRIPKNKQMSKPIENTKPFLTNFDKEFDSVIEAMAYAENFSGKYSYFQIESGGKWKIRQITEIPKSLKKIMVR